MSDMNRRIMIASVTNVKDKWLYFPASTGTSEPANFTMQV